MIVNDRSEASEERLLRKMERKYGLSREKAWEVITDVRNYDDAVDLEDVSGYPIAEDQGGLLLTSYRTAIAEDRGIQRNMTQIAENLMRDDWGIRCNTVEGMRHLLTLTPTCRTVLRAGNRIYLGMRIADGTCVPVPRLRRNSTVLGELQLGPREGYLAYRVGSAAMQCGGVTINKKRGLVTLRLVPFGE